MDKIKKKKFKKLFKFQETEIRKILKEWDPIPSSPQDEYDCIIHQIINKLHKGSSEKNIKLLIESEMANHFGIEEENYKIKECGI